MNDLSPSSGFGSGLASGFGSADLASVLMRRYLVFFLPQVFRTLHPDAGPLKMVWYLYAMCHAFQRAGLGLTRRLVINVPPRNLKSITSIAFAAWMLGNNPRLKLMLVTYSKELSAEHIENLRRIMAQGWYRALFPATRLVKGGKGRIIRTTLGGGCRSVTVGGATTGFGADIILIDDAMNAADIVSEAKRAQLDRFYSGTVLTRLNNKGRGIIISIQQRLGEDDLPARLIEAGAEHLNLPAYDDQMRVYDIGFGRIYRRPIGQVLRPHDEGRAVLDALRREMGPHAFATQYLGLPSSLEGNIIDVGAFLRFNLGAFKPEMFDARVQSWDLAVSEEPHANWTVCMTFGRLNDTWYLIDVLRVRKRYPQVRDLVKAMALKWRVDKTLIEDAGPGMHLWQDLCDDPELSLVAIRPDADKVTRMVGQLTMIEDGKIKIPYDAPWLDIMLKEFRAFPNVSFDDQVDALSQFLRWAKMHPYYDPPRFDPLSGARLRTRRRGRPLRSRVLSV